MSRRRLSSVALALWIVGTWSWLSNLEWQKKASSSLRSPDARVLGAQELASVSKVGRELISERLPGRHGDHLGAVKHWTPEHKLSLEPYARNVFLVPKSQLLVCIYPKAGTTSFFHFLYHGLVGRRYPVLNHSLPESKLRESFIQHVEGERWHGLLRRFSDLSLEEQRQFLVGSADREATYRNYYRLAIKRHPISRLVSAWKSKLQCAGAGDTLDQRELTHHLLNLAQVHNRNFSVMTRKSQKKSSTCLSLSEYVEVLEAIGNQHLHHELDSHFLKQDCLERFIAYDETISTESLDEAQFERLQEARNFSPGAIVEHMHKSMPVAMELTAEQVERLMSFVSLS